MGRNFDKSLSHTLIEVKDWLAAYGRTFRTLLTTANRVLRWRDNKSAVRCSAKLGNGQWAPSTSPYTGSAYD